MAIGMRNFFYQCFKGYWNSENQRFQFGTHPQGLIHNEAKQVVRVGENASLQTRVVKSDVLVPIAEELRAGMGRQVFGCDICQDVCPWNRRSNRNAPVPADPVMEARPELVNPSLAWLAEMTEEEFGRAFYGSPVKRAKYSGLRRNVAIAMGNSGDRTFVTQLELWAQEEDPVLAEAAAWALARLAGVNVTAPPDSPAEPA